MGETENERKKKEKKMSRMEDEEFRRRKIEEALEVKSLRRIISAYLNYPEAAEEDIRRYESNFRRLPPSHKALLLHLPLKYKNLRWCISQNSYFIFEMLKAFDPPLDMSQDIDISSEQFVDNVSNNHPFSGERNPFPCRSESSSGQISSLKADEPRSRESANAVHGSPKAETVCEEKKTEPLVESNPGNCSIGSAFDKKVENADGNNVKNCDNHPALSSVCVSSPDWLDPALQLHVPLVDVDKVRCIIRNIVRDWASEGQRERDQCYKPILEELSRLFPDCAKGSPRSCLVPGAGLGRLALEISCLGFISQGNEFSYYMMICSSFILNQTQTVEEWTIYPWVHSNCNSLSDSDQLRPVSFPDIHPASAGITEGFSMCGGDFVEVYNDPSQLGVWDAVVTCFFIDTAHNIVEYIEIISRVLKDGGVWINLGPLLYHFADMYNQEDDMSIELSLEDVKRVASHYGFQIEKESTIETTYTTNPRSMMQNRYFAAFWTMRKKSLAKTEQRA